MKKSALLLALAGLGLAAVPSQAAVQVPVTFLPNFTATLNNISSGQPAYIAATTTTGSRYNAGSLSFDPTNNQLSIFNATGISPDPANTNFFFDPTYDVASDVTLTNLSLSEVFNYTTTNNGALQTETVTNAPLYADPLGTDPATITNALDTGVINLYTALVNTPGVTLVSATLTGQFDAGNGPGNNQPVLVIAPSPAVPEASSFALLGLGLLPVGLVLRARAARRTL